MSGFASGPSVSRRVRPHDNALIAAGFRGGDYDVPVRYPVACHPEAQPAGAAATGEQGG